MADDDRPKRSWREIDNMRERSYYRSDNSSPGSKRRARKEEIESRHYKSELDKIFSGGSLAPGIAEKLAEAPVSEESKERHELIKKIRSEEKPAKLMEYLTKLYKMSNSLPRVEDVLIPATEHSNPAIALAAINQLLDMQKNDLLKRAGFLKQKLKSVISLDEDEEVSGMAAELLSLLD